MRDRVVHDYFGVSLTIVWDPKSNAAIALRHAFLTGAPPAHALAHEMGHAFGLPDFKWQPFRLMGSPSFGTFLSDSELSAGKSAVETRNGR